MVGCFTWIKELGRRHALTLLESVLKEMLVHDPLVREFIVRDPEWNDFGIFVKY